MAPKAMKDMKAAKKANKAAAPKPMKAAQAFENAVRLRKIAKAPLKFIGVFKPRNQESKNKMSQETKEPGAQDVRNLKPRIQGQHISLISFVWSCSFSDCF